MKTTLKNFITKSGKYVATAASIITVEGFIRDLRNQNVKVKYETELNRNRELEDRINSLLENKIIDEGNKTKVMELVSRRSNSLEIVREDVKKIQELKTSLSNSNLTDDVKNTLNEHLNKQIDKLSTDINHVNGDLSELLELIKNLGSSSSSSNQFINTFNFTDLTNNFQYLIELYQKYLATLSLEEKGALANILISITLLFCLGSLISIFYIEYLIKKFNLEIKYSRIARFIKFRRKFQQYYFLFNSIFIFVGLITIIYINYLYFTL